MKKSKPELKRIGIVANPEKPKCRDLTRLATRLITASGREVVMDRPTAEISGWKGRVLDTTAALTRDVDLLVVFGGDGTMLRLAREIAHAPTPVLGVNAGGLGFLTAVPSPKFPEVLKAIWNGDYLLEERSLIEAQGRAQDRPFRELALNDFVLSRGTVSRMIELEVLVDDQVLTLYRCDGLIVSSPTGSTAYSLAAGGAIVSPTAEVFAITPICPHTLSNRSVIVSLRSTITVRVLSRRLPVNLTADGQVSLPLTTGDEVRISRGRRGVQLVRPEGTSFYETLRRKLHWSGSNL